MTRTTKAALLTGAALTALGLTVQEHRPKQQPLPFGSEPIQWQIAPDQTPRVNYRLSVVPGGIRSSAEFYEAVVSDEVVAAHYRDRNGLLLSPRESTRLPQAVWAYVSYRRKDRVLWTATKRRIPAGEAVLPTSDGFYRVRCGNRLAFTPRLPVELHAPTDAELSQAERPALTPVPEFTVPGGEETTPRSQPTPIPNYTPESGPGLLNASAGLGAAGVLVPGAFGGLGWGAGGFVAPLPVAVVAVAPEPGTVGLVASVLCGGAMWRLLRRKAA